VFWGLLVAAVGWLVAGSWHDASPHHRVAAVGLVVTGLVAGVWNARQIPHRINHRVSRLDAAISAGGFAVGLNVIAAGLSADQRFLLNAAMLALLAFFTVSLPAAYREQRRRERAEREWAAYTDQFRDAAFSTRRDWPPTRGKT
jgi:hypothetical protein